MTKHGEATPKGPGPREATRGERASVGAGGARVQEYPFRLLEVGTVGSTQDEARALVHEGAQSGTLVIANAQTAGRGRGGHAWSSAPGLGLWLTLVHRSVRMTQEWPIFTSAGALAVCRAIERLGLDPRILWPNDILIQGRKVCGILAETEGDALLIGIGVNLAHVSGDFPPDLRGTATSIAIELARMGRAAPDRGGLLEMVLPPLGSVIGRIEAGGPGEIIHELWARSAVRGCRVEVRSYDSSGSATIRGEAIGLNDLGGLIVRRTAGTVELLSGTLLGIQKEVR